MKLTNEQLLPIKSGADNKLILAGPGTGKSYTILGFIVDLIESKSISPNNIFVLTFTRAASAELKHKIKEEITSTGDLPQVFTLHGFSLRQLMKNAKNIKALPHYFSIADDYEERYIIMEDLKRFLNIIHINEVRKLFNLLSSNWETLNADRTDWEINFESPEFVGAWKQHREIYGYVLRSELVYQFKNLLIQEPDARIDGPIEYLIVDEYQDLNRCDLLVISELSKKDSKLFCAGDDDQSIYGFRYAFPEGIRNFTKDIANSEQFLITECRRCDKTILDFSLNVIKQDYKRIPKSLVSITGKPGNYFILRFQNQNNEADKIAQIILSLNTNHDIQFNDIIILLRSDFHNVFSNIIKSKLIENSIKISTTKNYYEIFDSNQGLFLIAIIKLLQNIENDLSLRTLLQLSPGVGLTTIDSIYNYAVKNKIRFSKAIEQIKSSNVAEFKTNNKLNTAIENIFSIKEKCTDPNKSFEEIINDLLNCIPNSSDEFITNINEFIKTSEIDSIDNFISVITDFLGPAEQLDDRPDGIRIMTMHQAKGLSASAVFVVAVEEEYIPGRGDVDEERRLLYVSLTRSRKYLFITYCKDRIGQQKHTGYKQFETSKRNLSRYIKDIPDLKYSEGESFVL